MTVLFVIIPLHRRFFQVLSFPQLHFPPHFRHAATPRVRILRVWTKNAPIWHRHSRHFGQIAAYIRRKYRADRNDTSPVTFREFVWYIIDQRARRRRLDRHWMPMHVLCQPCRIPYDFVGHYETLSDDNRYVLAAIGIHDNGIHDDQAQFPQPATVNNSSQRVAELFAQLTAAEFRRLVDIYRLDFDLFGYSPRPLWPSNRVKTDAAAAFYAYPPTIDIVTQIP